VRQTSTSKFWTTAGRGDDKLASIGLSRVGLQSNRCNGATVQLLGADQSADESLVNLNFTSWNQIAAWLKRLDTLRTAA
jgi:hypothetical protein